MNFNKSRLLVWFGIVMLTTILSYQQYQIFLLQKENRKQNVLLQTSFKIHEVFIEVIKSLGEMNDFRPQVERDNHPNLI